MIFLSFASVRCDDYKKAIYSFKNRICEIYDDHLYLTNSTQLSKEDRDEFAKRRDNLHDLNGSIREDDIQFLSRCIYYHHNVRPIILLDEYDTPLIDAYVSGCYDDIIKIYQTLFAQTFKMNRFFYRAIITGINKVSKNSLYSDMNNVRVYTMLSEGFEDCFGFTEQEVMDILKCQDIDLMKEVKANYDGFIVGKAHDIYNPWSICNFVLDGEFRPYWVNTSSNELISELIKAYPNVAKSDIEDIIQGKALCKHINEDLALQYIKGDADSFWALMVAVGYVTAEKMKTRGVLDEEEMCEYKLASTNAETNLMIKRQILAMFPTRSAAYNDFTHYLVNGNIEMVNNVLNDILLNCISYFDTADSGGGKNPAENFYHGLVLGMIVKLKDKYNITSNRESGLGRYDICMIPVKEGYDAFIIEFKIRNHKTEASLEATAANALAQIDEKNYVASIRAQGIQDNNIRKLAFAFDGKEGLVVSV